MDEEWKWLTECHINLFFVGFCGDNISEGRSIMRMSWKIDACWLRRKLNRHMEICYGVAVQKMKIDSRRSDKHSS